MATQGQVIHNTVKIESLGTHGVQEVEMPKWRANTTTVSFAFTGNTDDLGTLSFEVKYHPDANWEQLVDAAGNQRVSTISASGIRSFTLENTHVHSIRVTPANTTGSYVVIFHQSDLLR